MPQNPPIAFPIPCSSEDQADYMPLQLSTKATIEAQMQ
jgi:hypothetical protein